MAKLAPLAVVTLFSVTLAAQQPVAAAATPTATALPAAHSQEASLLLDKACARMLAVGSGTFRSDEEQDPAMLRGQNLPIGRDGPSVRGGWHGELGWGDTEDDSFVVGRGRMVVKTEDGWRLRARTLASGQQAPFLLSPPLLFLQLQELAADKKQVANVEAGEVAGRPCAILALTLDGAAATELALGGGLPLPGGGMMLGLGMLGGGHAPEKTYAVDLALFVDADSGEVLRLRAKVYEDNPMLANMRVQFGRGGGDESGDEGAGDKKEAAATGDAAGSKPVFKKGLPERKPGKTESVAYLKVDFKDLGTANAPGLDDTGKRWLGVK